MRNNTHTVASSPVRIFFSYAREDEQLRNELEKHLATLKHSALVETWHDRCIIPGNEWEQEINDKIEQADLILVLVSVDFLASDYCSDREMSRALERHDRGEARVIPIILRPVSWTRTRLGRLQALPRDGRPVTDWPDRDAAFHEVAHGIEQAIEALPAKVDVPLDAGRLQVERKQLQADKTPPISDPARLVNANPIRMQMTSSAYRWYSSYQVFGSVMMASAVLVVIIFLICWRIFKRDQSASYGLPDSLALFAASAYGPVIGTTFVGYRDAIATLFPQGSQQPVPKPLQGAVFFYPLALSGVVSALGILIYVSTGIDDTVAKFLIGAAATYWGTTVGWIFDKLFRRFTVD